MFDDEITLFNRKYNSKLKDYVYIRTYLSGVNVDFKKAVNVIKSGLENADSGTVIIPEEVETENKEFVRPTEFQKAKGTKSFSNKQVNKFPVCKLNELEITVLTNENPIWTLQKGDIIVMGLIDCDINGNNTISDLRKNYDDVYEITSVDTKLKGGLPHWEVGVK